MTAPAAPCACLSGLTEAQVRLLELGGALEVVEWLACQAYQANADPVASGNAEVADYLKKLQLGVSRAQHFCREHGWKKGTP